MTGMPDNIEFRSVYIYESLFAIFVQLRRAQSKEAGLQNLLGETEAQLQVNNTQLILNSGNNGNS